METLTTVLENGTIFIFKNCYIFMNIAMMVISESIKIICPDVLRKVSL